MQTYILLQLHALACIPGLPGDKNSMAEDADLAGYSHADA